MPLALITGPTAGIGRAFARALAAEGYDLVLVSRDEARLRELGNELSGAHGVCCEVMPADLGDPEQTQRIETRLGSQPFDILVNNAGFGLQQPFHHNDIEAEQRNLDVLVGAVMRLTHAALRPMRAAGRGDIINVSSVAGYLPRGTYGAHKAWVTSFSSWAHVRYQTAGVRVMALCPGFVRTEFHDRMQVDMSNVKAWMWLDADDVVTSAMRDLRRGRAVSVPSVRYKALMGVARVSPPQHRRASRAEAPVNADRWFEPSQSVRRQDVRTDRGVFAALACMPRKTSLPHGNALLVPGYTGSKEDFAPLLPLLAESGWSAAAFDQRGQFETPATSADFSLSSWAEDAATVVRAMWGSGERVHLVGHSFGGLVAAAAALEHPDLWASLTLLCSGPGAVDEAKRDERRALAAELKQQGLEATYRASVDEVVAGSADAAAEQFLHRRYLSNSPTALIAMCHALVETPDRSRELAALDVPVAVVRGEHDDAWPHDVQDRLADTVGTRVVVIPGAAHSPPREAPAETRDALIRIWMR